MMMKPLVVGLGNPLFGDDGVGVAVAAAARERAGVTNEIEVVELGIRPFDLLPYLFDERHVVVVDALACAEPAGTVLVFGMDEVLEAAGNPQGYFISIHQQGLIETLRIARFLGARARVTVVGVVAGSWNEPSLSLSELLKFKLPDIVDLVLREALK